MGRGLVEPGNPMRAAANSVPRGPSPFRNAHFLQSGSESATARSHGTMHLLAPSQTGFGSSYFSDETASLCR